MRALKDSNMLQTRNHGELDSLEKPGTSVTGSGGIRFQARCRRHWLGKRDVKAIRTDCGLSRTGCEKLHGIANWATDSVNGCKDETMDVIMIGPWMLSSQNGLEHRP